MTSSANKGLFGPLTIKLVDFALSRARPDNFGVYFFISKTGEYCYTCIEEKEEDDPFHSWPIFTCFKIDRAMILPDDMIEVNDIPFIYFDFEALEVLGTGSIVKVPWQKFNE